ncbi:type VI secretion protein [Pseudomonas zhanjiangensis]|uniref:Type VI secretion protein n=1 Tax=Pseudomonas zhanjiangensis TaxID=3239015 RepID=A0ABV3YMY3_9PSED
MRLGRFICVGLMLLQASCSYIFQPSVELRSLTLDVAPKANDDTPLAVDFVAVEDPELLKLLLSIPAKQWFEQREQLRRDYLQSIGVWSLELVPGQFMAARDIPLAGNPAVGLLVYAGYNNPGTHRLRLEQQKTVWLRFESKNMRLLGDSSLD